MHKKAFIFFAECERKKHAISEQLDKLILQLSDLEKKLDTGRKKREAAKQVVVGAQKQIHEAELELKSLESQEVEKKRRVLSTKAAKEYESLLKEIEQIAQKKSEIEDHVFLLWEERDNSLQHQQVVEQETEQEITQVNDAIFKIRHECDQTEKQRDDLAEKCAEAAKLVDATLLSTYRSMQESIAVPAVPIESSSCSGCFYAVPSMDMSKAGKGEIVHCNECYRFLYIPKPLS